MSGFECFFQPEQILIFESATFQKMLTVSVTNQDFFVIQFNYFKAMDFYILYIIGLNKNKLLFQLKILQVRF